MRTPDPQPAGRIAGLGRRRRDALTALALCLLLLLCVGRPVRVQAQDPPCEHAATVDAAEPVLDADAGVTTLRYTLTAAAAVESLFLPLAPWNWAFVNESTTPGWTTVEQEAASGGAGLRWDLSLAAGERTEIQLVLDGLWVVETGTAVVRVAGCPPQELALPAPSHWQPVVQPSVEPATLYGYTWEDQDGDGYWDEGEPGTAGQQVTLRFQPLGGHVETLSATTDAAGQFRLVVPGGGAVVLTAVLREGWVATTPLPIHVTLASSGTAGPYTIGLRRAPQAEPPTPTPTRTPAPTAGPPPTTPEPPPEVPEASSLMLLAAGGGALVAWWRLHRRRA